MSALFLLKDDVATVEPHEVGNLCKSGVKGYNEMNGRIYDTDGASPTIRANSGGHNEIKIAEMAPSLAVRKLTALETWRLMGFSDDDFYRAKYGPLAPTALFKRIEKRNLSKAEWKEVWRYMRHEQMSNSQLYKQAGNSIVVDVLMAIFKEML